MTIKILVCCHKKDICVKQEPYMPIHVGHALHSETNLGMQCDDEGDNISLKNGSYCELTGMYWAWKNLKNVDIIGLNHYRRYFDFHKKVGFAQPEKQIKTKDFGTCNFDIPQKIVNLVNNGSVIVAKPRSYPVDIYTNYCCDHYSTDIKNLRKVIEEFCEKKYIKAFDTIMDSCKLIHYNMFLMQWEQYEKYCQWLFNILAIMEQRTNIENYDTTQKRIYGYLAERLFNVYLLANKVKTKQYPILWFFDDYYPQYSSLTSILRNFRNKLLNIMGHPKRYFIKK